MRNILECMVIVMEMLITIILQFVQLNNKSKVDVYILDKNNNDDGLSQERLWLISRKVYIQSPWQFVHPNSQTQFLVRWKNFPDIWRSLSNLDWVIQNSSNNINRQFFCWFAIGFDAELGSNNILNNIWIQVFGQIAIQIIFGFKYFAEYKYK